MPVPVRLLGTAPGVREGGLLEHVHEYIEVEAIPKLIPPEVEVDISQLGIGDSVLVGDLPWEEGVRPLLPPGDVVVTVLAPRVLVVAEAGEEVEAAPEEEPPG
jgi:large subunit ribosomal protein L25